jgi:hypothetical protein
VNVPGLLIGLGIFWTIVAVLWLNSWREDRHPSRPACRYRKADFNSEVKEMREAFERPPLGRRGMWE